MMKVILDTSVVHGEGQSSFRYFSELIPRLQKESDVDLELIPSPYYELPHSWFPKKPAYQPLQTKAHWLPQGKLRTILSKAKRTVENYRQKRALYQNPNQTLFHSFYYTVPPTKKSHYVTVAHDATPELFQDELGLKENFSKHLEIKKKSLLSADHIIAASESTKNDIMRFYSIPAHKIDCVYVAVNTDFFNDLPSQPPKITKPYVLQVGGRLHHRNFGRLIEAFSLGRFSKDYLLVCAGASWSETELRNLKKLGIEHRVVLIKNPSNEELKSLYQNAKLLAYPSLYEGFGVPPLEAMACGTPVATSKNSGSIPEVAGDAAHYFDPRDPSDIAKTIEELLNPKLAETYIKKGFENLKRFSWDKTAQETLNCYRKVFSA